VRTFTLKGEEEFFNEIAHAIAPGW
jgi:hypothetical protein